MTRYKKELSKRGYKQEHEFDFLPCGELEGTSLKLVDEKFIYKEFYVFGTAITVIDKNYNIIERDFD